MFVIFWANRCQSRPSPVTSGGRLTSLGLSPFVHETPLPPGRSCSESKCKVVCEKRSGMQYVTSRWHPGPPAGIRPLPSTRTLPGAGSFTRPRSPQPGRARVRTSPEASRGPAWVPPPLCSAASLPTPTCPLQKHLPCFPPCPPVSPPLEPNMFPRLVHRLPI